MKGTRLLGLALVLLSTSLVVAQDSESEAEDAPEINRTWTGTTGAAFEAKLLEYTEEQVVLRRKSDGRQFTIPLDRLIEADREFVAALLREDERDTLLTDGPYATMIHGEFEPGEFENGMLFNIWGAADLDPKKRYPLVIHLHGTDLRGDDNEKPITHTVVKLFTETENQAERPCFVLVPQCPSGVNWAGEEGDKLHALINDVLELLPVAVNRIYLTGNDMGAHGVWYLLETNPQFYAAATVSGGAGKPAAAEKLKHIPTWSVCGKEDRFRYEGMRAMANAFDAAGATDARFTAAPGLKWVGIDTWLNEERLAWLFNQSRNLAAPSR